MRYSEAGSGRRAAGAASGASRGPLLSAGETIRRRRRRGEGGFTLIELMIVLAIIGLLATLGIPEYMRTTILNRAKLCRNNLRIIQEAKYQYFINCTVSPDAVLTEGDLIDYLRGGHLPREPTGGLYMINAVRGKTTCATGFEGHDL